MEMLPFSAVSPEVPQAVNFSFGEKQVLFSYFLRLFPLDTTPKIDGKRKTKAISEIFHGSFLYVYYFMFC